MRILFFSPHQIWPVNTGARLRNYYLAKSLAARCPVTLFQILQPGESLITPSAEAGHFEQVVGFEKDRSYTPAKVLKGLVGPLPLTVLNYSSPTVAAGLETLLAAKPFDAVQLESSHLFSYLKLIRQAAGAPRVLLDWHNIESELMARFAGEVSSLPKKWVGSRTATLLRRVEQRLLHECDAHAVVSERERQELLRRSPQAILSVIPNGVDVSRNASVETSSPKGTLLFVGSMDYHANIDAVTWFAREIWPSILREVPALRFVIAGRSPSAQVKALASDSVTVTGTVEDVRPFYSDALAVVVPLRVAGGTRLKILEAMSLQVPVISTTLGAEGIQASSDINMLLADTIPAFVSAVRRVAAEPATRQRLAEAARRLVVEEYDWDSIGSRLYALHLQIAERRSRN